MGECLIVRSGSGVDTSNATASSGMIVDGYTCYVNDDWAPGDTSFSGTWWRERLNSDVWTSSTETWSFTWSGLQTLNSFSRFNIWAMLSWYKGSFGARMYDWSAWLSK